MPSFKELAKSAHRTLCRCLATIILSFCGIASFSVIGITTLSLPASAVDTAEKSIDINLTLGSTISVRILDSTATSDLSLLPFDLTPTAAGVTSTKRAVVDVSTSNITGYKLYVEANGKDHNNQYTTDLVQGDTADSHVIPTSTSTASNKNFWNYVNPATSTATVVPAHGNPDQIGYLLEPTTSTKANVDINVGVDTTITAGSYTNQLLFTAIANAESIDYTLYFDKNAPIGVDPSDIENFPVNQTASASATSYTFTIPDTAPTLVGYAFGGYVDPTATPGSKGSSADPYLPGDNVTVVADPTASVISGNKTLYAQWELIPHVTVTAGTGIASTTGSGDYSPGANVSIGATLSAGYHFADPKWTVNSGGVTITNDSFTMPGNDVSITANGAINTCSIHYNVNTPSDTTSSGSTADSSFTYNTATATTANGFAATGYDWAGWAESADGAVIISTSGGSITAEQAASWCGTHGTAKNLYAKWTKEYTYTLNLNTNDGTTNKQILNYPSSGGTTDTSHQFTSLNTYAPTREGYNFLGWATTSTGTSYVTSYTLDSSGASSVPTSAGFPVTGNLYAIWESTGPSCANGANRVCYISNEPSGTVSGIMEDQTIVYMTSTTGNTVDQTTLSSSTTELTLYSPNWTLSGYGFKGWNTKADGTGTMYGPNETITLSSDQQAALGSRGLVMYAQWVASAGNMASWSGCSNLTQGSVTALTYGSDTYAVAKLADGKCWMIENYRLDSTAAGTKTTSMTVYPYNRREYNVTNVSGTAGAYPINLTSPAAALSTSNQYSWKSYGGYYSWASAINTTTESSNKYYNWNGSSFSNATTATAQGICPTGWRLPRSYAGSETNNTESDFRYLNSLINNGSWTTVSTAEGSNNWRKYPNNFVFAGYWTSDVSYLRGMRGYYWSSTVSNDDGAYSVYLYSTAVRPANTDTKSHGFSVRCMIGS